MREGCDYVRTDYVEGCVHFHLAGRADRWVCPDCHSRRVHRNGRRVRHLQTVPRGLQPIYLVAEAPIGQCQDCGRSFEISPFAPAYAHYTHVLATVVQDLQGLLCLSGLAAATGLGWGPVKAIVSRRLERTA